MRTIIITIQDRSHDEFVSCRLVDTYECEIDDRYFISLVRKAERDLAKMIEKRDCVNEEIVKKQNSKKPKKVIES